MLTGLRRCFLFVCAAALFGQTPAQPPVPALPPMQTPASPVGLETDWAVGEMLKDIAAQAGRLAPVLDRIDARSWVDQGASETYAEQLQAVKDQNRALGDSAAALARNPEQLSSLLDVFFRMQAIDSMLQSVEEGIRKYGSKPEAQTLAQTHAETSTNRDRLQHYIVALASEREREYSAMDREAQRCRSVVTAPKTLGKKK